MKPPIKLSTKQKNRLLRMCKYLFPDLQKKCIVKGTKYYDASEKELKHYLKIGQ